MAEGNYTQLTVGNPICLRHGEYYSPPGQLSRCPLCIAEDQLNKSHGDIQAPNFVDPPHYVAGRKFEPYNVISDWFHNNYNLGQVCKYISRAGRKGPALPDLQKASWYLQREIERLTSK